MSMRKEISAVEMMAVVARAGIAARAGSAEIIMSRIRQLSPLQLIREYHVAVALLGREGLLSAEDEVRAHWHAQDYLASPMGSQA